ncbi:MAG: hypothetical protein KatS3mg131_3114 [Candidatus Tectimicrobiota bacterium]|nr:MAG: hypothetical protein KatS3mg131_3114 [Candidatus Tectomicrobia bacterium]
MTLISPPSSRRQRAGLALLALLGALALSGCDVLDLAAELLRIDTDTAQAQQEVRIETFVIDASSFLLLADSEPTLTVQDGATIYTMQSAGSVTFTPAGGSPQTFSLEAGDMVIERPGSGTLTLRRVP